MSKDNINSGESEGIFNEWIEEKIRDKVEEIIKDGNFEDHMGDVIIEVNDIKPPVFTYGNPISGGKGNAPGIGGDKMRFTFPFEKFMELIAKRLQLPDLSKEGKGKIKEVSQEFKTFGPNGSILDKKRTFKRALKGSVAQGIFNPENGEYDFQIRKKDKRYHVPKRVEKPKYKAVCFYMGDISGSTYGDRIILEKKVVNFIYNWLNYSYGKNNVEHRFFVHDWEAYEVQVADFFKVEEAGGTRAASVFELVGDIARNEYNIGATNYYAFYFGDGELFDNDGVETVKIIKDKMDSIFNRIGVVEVMPSNYSNLISELLKHTFKSLKFTRIKDKTDLIHAIKIIFSKSHESK